MFAQAKKAQKSKGPTAPDSKRRHDSSSDSSSRSGNESGKN
jgi:hypothetical protein